MSSMETIGYLEQSVIDGDVEKAKKWALQILDEKTNVHCQGQPH